MNNDQNAAKEIDILSINTHEVTGALKSRLIQMFRICIERMVESSANESQWFFDRDVYVGKNSCKGFHLAMWRSLGGDDFEERWIATFTRGDQALEIRASAR